MVNKPRNIGTAAETAVVRYLVANGFPHAERRSLKGNLDQGDITGTPGICWEVKGGAAAKNASDGQVATWLEETERERVNARANIGILVLQRKGIGASNAGRWWAIERCGFRSGCSTWSYLSHITHELHSFGYGEPNGLIYGSNAP